MLTDVKVENIQKQEAGIGKQELNNVQYLTLFYGDQKTFPNELSCFYKYLSKWEINRSKRFKYETDERTYVITHALVNRKIAENLKVDFNKLKINYFGDKKPDVEGGGIEFNLSHSSDYFAFALSKMKDYYIGVDIEVIKDKQDIKLIVNNYFHKNEIEYILNNKLSSFLQHKRFYEVWTRKEAFLKMLGIGISEELSEIDLSPGERNQMIADNSFVDNRYFKETYIYTLNLPEDRVMSLSTNHPAIIIPEYCEVFENLL